MICFELRVVKIYHIVVKIAPKQLKELTGKSNYQNIFDCLQAQFGEVSEADLKAIDSRISDLSTQVQAISQGCRQLDAELKELNSSLTTEEMMSEIQELKAECSGYRERLEKIKSATNHVTPEQKEMVYKERHLYVKEWKKRKRLASDMMGSILEGYPKTKKQFLEEVGVETDEDCKVTMPST
ncbi:homologous-pairing protein 2 homolog [Salmo salar]|uniref:Homologous-pairing protein 2 homolog n=1 Tax=Salmo salar TaxID=8030 RepID=B5XAC4_SALSA|nr:homologous-pairing protein 2 homolog [Salmo salar]ACI67794.1 Homologous-pairing protein 2 homolog [Salmo salar]|eukprot:NP_001134504.1 Homologous-pairing protein 2 homolog [Salmo salar]